MRIQERSKEDISAKLKNMGDYVKMGYLKDCLKLPLDLETKKYVLANLAIIYEKRKMFPHAGKAYRILAGMNDNKNSMVNDLVKSTEMYIKSGDFVEADFSYQKALSVCESKEKNRVIEAIKTLYKAQGKKYDVSGKRRYALKVYEKLIKDFPLDIMERKQVNDDLLKVYTSLGRVKEYFELKKKS